MVVNFFRQKKYYNFKEKLEKTPKIGEKWQKSRNFVLFKIHPYVAPFSPKKYIMYYISSENKFLGGGELP